MFLSLDDVVGGDADEALERVRLGEDRDGVEVERGRHDGRRTHPARLLELGAATVLAALVQYDDEGKVLPLA